MSIPLRVLLAEDSENDALLLMRHLRKGGYDPIYTQVQTADEMERALQEGDWDIIISDYSMPQFTGLEALKIFKKSNTDIPFLIISGTIGETLAVEAMRAGANDYLMKDNLTRLVPAIERELRDASYRRERKKSAQALIESEQQYRILFESSPMSIAILGLDGTVLDCNPAAERFTGLARDEMVGKLIGTLALHPENVTRSLTDDYMHFFNQQLAKNPIAQFEGKMRYKDGSIHWVDVHLTYLKRDETPWAIQIILRDVTEQKQAENTLLSFAERLTILHEVDKAILSARSAELITQAALFHVRLLIPYTIAGVSLIDAEKKAPILLAAYHDEKLIDDDSFPYQLIYDMPDVMQTLGQGAPYVLESVDTYPELTSYLGALGLSDVSLLLNVPLIFQGELMGFMSFGAEKPSVFGSEQIDIAYELALQLAIAIQHARLHEAIAYHATELEVRVQERTAELQAANERLTALSRAKDEFVSNVSHELRTPLSSLMMRQSLLARSPDQIERHLKVMDRETMRLKYMLEDLLRLSRLDQGRTLLEVQPVDLNQLVLQYVEDRMLFVEEKQLNLSCTCSENTLTIQADAGLLEQVLGILFNNAINYTQQGGSILVRTFKLHMDSQNWMCFSIKDSGPGISSDEMPQLFERFFRGNAGRKSQVPGTGLGLSIAKEIIDRHEGRIKVESEGIEGKGTTFTVCLPEKTD